MLKTDEVQVKILLNLLEHKELGFNELYSKVSENSAIGFVDRTIPKGTFKRRLFSLIEDWNPSLVLREPSITKAVKKGKKVQFYLTETGKRKAMVEGLLTATELKMRSILKDSLDEAIEHGKNGALTSATAIVKSRSIPILGFLSLLSVKQYSELAKELESEKARSEISDILPKFIDFYSSKQDQFFAQYLSQKQKIFFFGNFPEKISLEMQEAIELGIFKNYTHIFKQIMNSVEPWWANLWQNFKQGKKPIEFPSGKEFRYDLKEQKVIETKRKN